MKKSIYIAGPMRGIPHFNFPKFLKVAAALRQDNWTVFCPAERDIALHGEAVYASPTGDLRDIAHLGFSHRNAMRDDLTWICENATALFMLRGWEASSGATAEWSLARCLGLEFLYE